MYSSLKRLIPRLTRTEHSVIGQLVNHYLPIMWLKLCATRVLALTRGDGTEGSGLETATALDSVTASLVLRWCGNVEHTIYVRQR